MSDENSSELPQKKRKQGRPIGYKLPSHKERQAVRDQRNQQLAETYPAKYHPESTPMLVGALIERGMSITAVSATVGVAYPTFRKWIENYEPLADAIFNSKILLRQKRTEEVETKMYERATGMTVLEDGKEKYYPPEVSAGKFWLSNRAPKDWSEKTQGDTNVQVNAPAIIVLRSE